MPDRWYSIPWSVASGPFNMALDAALMAAPPDRPVIRVYGWHSGPWDAAAGSPDGVRSGCISLGRFQRGGAGGVDGGVIESLRPFGVTRRTTGGGAIFHWREVTYSIIGKIEQLRLYGSREAAYARYHNAWIRALSIVGKLPKHALWMPSGRGDAARNDGADRLFCFTRRTGYDVCAAYQGAAAGDVPVFDSPRPHSHQLQEVAEGRVPDSTPLEGKLIGSAQRHRAGVLLQHGSIKIDTSPLAPWEVSLFDLARDRRAEWLEASGSEVDYARLSAALTSHFAAALGITLELWQPTEETLADATAHTSRQFAEASWIESGRMPENRAKVRDI